MAIARLANLVGSVIGEKVGNMKRPFMEAAMCAIRERIPLVDFIIDVRDARLPFSSECHILHNSFLSSRRVIVFNKLDLAHPHLIGECIKHFQQNCPAFGVDSYNDDSIKELLKYLQAQARSLRKTDSGRNIITMMLIGIPNVGKSALCNGLHLLGRISAEEKGRVKHAVVSPLPGETKCIRSLKIASHPNIYILDTPGLLPSQMSDNKIWAKFALTGVIDDSLVEAKSLAQLLLYILNQSNEHKKWKNQYALEYAPLVKGDIIDDPKSKRTWSKDFSAEHTKDSVVLSVRRSLAETISSFKGNLHKEEDMQRLIQEEIISLRAAFNLYGGTEADIDHTVAVKLLDLYRIGRLGKYKLELDANLI